MPYLLDSNILIRYTLTNDPDHQVVFDAVQKLLKNGEMLYYATQNLAEFWAVITRPTTARGGYGLSVEDADTIAKQIEADFYHIPDSVDSHLLWRKFIVEHRVLGVQVHDTRLASVMQANGITHILTLNTTDFKRFGVTAVHPRDI
jgi:predicted nucleic acid-binding protein